MVSHFKKYLFVILLASSVLSASASTSLINYEKGRTPEEIGVRLVKNLLNRKDYMLYKTTAFITPRPAPAIAHIVLQLWPVTRNSSLN